MEMLTRLLVAATTLVVLLTPSTNALCEKKRDIVFIVDTSSSINETIQPLVRNFINSIIGHFNVAPDKTQIGLIIYDQFASVRWQLNAYTTSAEVVDAVNSSTTLPFRPPSDQNLHDALIQIRMQMFQTQNGARTDAEHIAIIITDGYARPQTKLTIPEAQNAWRTGIQLFAVAVTSDPQTQLQLKAIVSPPPLVDQNYWELPDHSSLQSIVGNVHPFLCDPPKARLPACVLTDLVIAFSIPTKKKKVPTATLR